MKRIKDWLKFQIESLLKLIGSIVGLIPAAIWLFIFLELFLYKLCMGSRLEIFVIQFPITLWVLVTKKG